MMTFILISTDKKVNFRNNVIFVNNMYHLWTHWEFCYVPKRFCSFPSEM